MMLLRVVESAVELSQKNKLQGWSAASGVWRKRISYAVRFPGTFYNAAVNPRRWKAHIHAGENARLTLKITDQAYRTLPPTERFLSR